jgi:ribosome-associated protein
MPTRTLNREPHRLLNSAELATHVAHLALEKKAHDILILDLRKLTSAADRFVICTADSETQVKAIADHLSEKLTELGMKPWHVEGRSGRRWVLIDFVDVVVHVFYSQTRAFYGLEDLWGDAPSVRIDDIREIA